MKVWINNYRNHWLSPYTILEKVYFWREIEYDEPVIEKWVNRLEPFCFSLQKIRGFINPKIDYVKIDRWDTWSMDHTLANIILPMLKQLKEDKHGAPYVDDKDVPKELKSTSAPPKENEWDTDDNHFLRWDWVMDEMIWAFEQKTTDDAESKFFEHPERIEGEKFEERIHRVKCDKVGLDAWQKRKANGFRLFGKYYEGLWD
jgi:hypothetical protein